MAKKNKTALANRAAQVAKTDKKLKKKIKRLSDKQQHGPMLKSSSQFGPVSSIATAPVAIGNSVRGASKNLQKTARGVIVAGRDFMFAPVGSPAAVTNWTTVGGTALTPAAFADSVIANYQRMYMKFRFKSFVVHYITSSSTSSTGDVMFYYSKDRTSVYLNQTSSQLLPFVFTDQNTVLGPQWVNHSAKFAITGDWKLTDYGMNDSIKDYADGEVFLLSKTTTTDSPGYVIFDYIVEFAEESFQPRLLVFPLPRIQWQSTCLGYDTAAVTKATTAFYAKVYGNDITGGSASTGAWKSSAVIGDIYKIIFDITNSTDKTGNAAWSNCTTSTLMEFDVTTVEKATTLTDGFTCYGVWNGTNMAFYQNVTNAFSAYNFNTPATQGGALRFGVTATIAFQIVCWCSYIGSYTDTNNFPNF